MKKGEIHSQQELKELGWEALAKFGLGLILTNGKKMMLWSITGEVLRIYSKDEKYMTL